jgi:hypothetical protein
MKAIALIFLTLFLGKGGCSKDTQNDIKEATIEYEANTRGFYQKIMIHDQKYKISKDRNGRDNPQEITISDKDWKELVSFFKDINLDTIPKLKSPTEKRFYDGAAIANLKVVYKGKTYETNGFDHGIPPSEIEKLVNKINSFAKEE